MLSMLRYCSNRMTGSVHTKIFSRKFMEVSEKFEIILKQRDHIPRGYKLVYRDRNHNFVGIAYHSINFLGCVFVGVLGYIMYYDKPIQEDAKHFKPSRFEAISIFTGVMSIFVMSLWLRQRFVLRIYFSEQEQKFTTIFIGRVPFTMESRTFPAKTLTFASNNTALPWRNTVFNMGGRKVYLFEDNFRTHSDFLKLLKPGEELFA